MPRSIYRGLFIVLTALLLANFSPVIGQAQVFDIDAPAAILIDARTGQVLYEKNADNPWPPASLVKIMTLLVVMDAVKSGQISLENEVVTSARASSIGGSQAWLDVGETHSLEKMLKAIAISSANDASVAVAEFLAGTEAAFTRLMQARAESLGLEQSYFGSADGLPEGPDERPSVITAREIAIISRELIAKHPEVLAWTSTRMEEFRAQPHFILYNTNGLLGQYEGLDGLKTGHTSAAGYNLVATAERGGVRLISVVLGNESATIREQRTRALLDYGFIRHAPVTVGEGVVGQVKIRTGVPEVFDVRVAEPVRLLQLRGQDVAITTSIDASAATAPIAQGDPVGEYIVTMNGAEAMRVPVYAATDVARANIFQRMWRGVRDFFIGLLP